MGEGRAGNAPCRGFGRARRWLGSARRRRTGSPGWLKLPGRKGHPARVLGGALQLGGSCGSHGTSHSPGHRSSSVQVWVSLYQAQFWATPASKVSVSNRGSHALLQAGGQVLWAWLRPPQTGNGGCCAGPGHLLLRLPHCAWHSHGLFSACRGAATMPTGQLLTGPSALLHRGGDGLAGGGLQQRRVVQEAVLKQHLPRDEWGQAGRDAGPPCVAPLEKPRGEAPCWHATRMQAWLQHT